MKRMSFLVLGYVLLWDMLRHHNRKQTEKLPTLCLGHLFLISWFSKFLEEFFAVGRCLKNKRVKFTGSVDNCGKKMEGKVNFIGSVDICGEKNPKIID